MKIPIKFKDTIVITTKELAKVYNTKENNLQNNFMNHKNQFKEGEHYFKVDGKELKEFKRLVKDIDQPLYENIKFAPVLYLWSHKGCSRHCKMLDTDEAWEQFDILEENYFNPKVLQLTNEDKAILNIIHAGDNLSRTLAIQEYKNVITEPLLNQIEELSPLAQKYNIFIDTEGLTNIDTFSKDLNIKKLGRNNMYKYLRNKGLLRKDNKPYQKYIDSGWFTVKPCGNHISNNEIIQDYKTYLTANGINKIIDMLIKDGYINIPS